MSSEAVSEILEYWPGNIECVETKVAKRRQLGEQIYTTDFDGESVGAFNKAKKICEQCLGQLGCFESAFDEFKYSNGFYGVRAGLTVDDMSRIKRMNRIGEIRSKITANVMSLINQGE